MFYVVQSGTTLKKMSPSGTVTALTLPTGVDIASAKRLRGAVLNNQVVLVYSPSANLTIDAFNTVRPMELTPPGAAATVSTAAGGTLSGSFKVKQTFFIKDQNGNVLVESDFGPASATVSPSAQWITVVPVKSAQTVSGTRLYRTTTGPGSTYFPWIDIEGNEGSTFRDDLSDAGLQLVAAPTDLGTSPKFSNIVEWKERLWGVPEEEFDSLWQSALNKAGSWPRSRTILIPPKQNDDRGITGLLRRKDELGVGRADRLFKIVGTSESNFTRQSVSNEVGIWATDSVSVAHDIGYFLGNPFGIYSWGPSGVKNISDEKVKAWFSTDTYFNRSRFEYAYGCYDPIQHAYICLLSAAGSTDLDRWIQYNIATDTWWGPHKTGAFTPTGCVTFRNSNNVLLPIIFASDGKLYQPQTTKTDGSSTAIDFDVESNWMSGGTPDIFKTWLDPSIVTEIQSAGTLTVTPRIGERNASAGSAISHDMTLGSQRLRRLGNGKFAQFRFRENTAGQDVTLYGFEVPFIENGRRS